MSRSEIHNYRNSNSFAMERCPQISVQQGLVGRPNILTIRGDATMVESL